MARRVEALSLGQLQDLKLLLAVLSKLLKPDRKRCAHQRGSAHFLLPTPQAVAPALHLPGGLSHIALVHELLGEQQTLLKMGVQSDSVVQNRTQLSWPSRPNF